MRQDLESGNLMGKGEDASFNILSQLTGLPYQGLKFFSKNYDGIYKQVPISWIVSHQEFKQMSEAHKKGSLDLFIIIKPDIRIAVRIQGSGHGDGLRGIGKAKHDSVQEKILKQFCQVVNVHKRNCPMIFKDKVNGIAIEEMINSFRESKVMIPSTYRS